MSPDQARTRREGEGGYLAMKLAQPVAVHRKDDGSVWGPVQACAQLTHIALCEPLLQGGQLTTNKSLVPSCSGWVLCLSRHPSPPCERKTWRGKMMKTWGGGGGDGVACSPK